MCCGKRQCIQCILMTYSIIGLILCLLGVFFIGYQDSTAAGIALDIFYCALVFSAAILGFILFCNETLFLAKVYIALLVALNLLDILGIIVKRGNISGKTQVEQTWEGQKEHPGLMDTLQRSYRCCGKYSSDDYSKELNQPIPKSCYGVHNDVPFRHGCISRVPELNFTTPYWFALFWELLWLAYTIWFFFHVKKRHEESLTSKRPRRSFSPIRL